MDRSLFRCRINNIDHYQADQIPDFDPPLPINNYGPPSKLRPKVPVIRAFGATETGQKVLMHIHGVFQYTYVEYKGSLEPKAVRTAINTLQTGIDHALAISFRKNAYDGKDKYVAHISLVKGVPFYGYHVGYKFFLKVYLFNPHHMTRLADLMREGLVLKRQLQPYESHMQYIAQWMCDYNLYGCAFLDCAKVKFRGPVPKYFEIGNGAHGWHDQSIPAHMISDDSRIPRQSYCALELDIKAEDIVNRRNVVERNLHQEFVERLNPLPIDKKLVQSMAGLWKDETRRRKIRMGIQNSGSSPFSADVLVSMSADSRNTTNGAWVHEMEYHEKLAKVVEEELADKSKKTFDDFVQSEPLEETVQTALESVKDFYAENMENLYVDKVLEREREQERVDMEKTYAEAESFNDFDDIASRSSRQGSVQRESSSRPVTPVNDELAPEIHTPMSFNEFADLGVRKAFDLSMIDEDDFDIPEDLLYSAKPKKDKKRARFDGSTIKPSKKQRLQSEAHQYDSDDADELEDAMREQKLEDLDNSLRKEVEQDHSQKVVPSYSPRINTLADTKTSSQGSSQDSTIRFPVVKNPNDPNTIKRMSQSSSSPDKNNAIPGFITPSPIMQSQNSARKSLNFTTPPSFAHESPIGRGKPLSFQGFPKRKTDGSLSYYAFAPPTVKHVNETMRVDGRLEQIYQTAYYSREKDVPAKLEEYAGKKHRMQSNTVPYLPVFDPAGESVATFGTKLKIEVNFEEEANDLDHLQRTCTLKSFKIAAAPPSKAAVMQYFSNADSPMHKSGKSKILPQRKRETSQIEPPTQSNPQGFKYASKQESRSVQHETQYMSVMALEVHVNTRGILAPNPEMDPITGVFWCLQSDDDNVVANVGTDNLRAGVMIVEDSARPLRDWINHQSPVEIEQHNEELELLQAMITVVRRYDPDILTGYEVHMGSWGYLIERARVKYDLNFCNEISRMREHAHGRFGRDEDKWGFDHTSTIRVTGRHTINVWRAMRGELNLLGYTLENVAFHLLHKRVPHYPFADLTTWWKSNDARDFIKVVDYFSSRVRIDLDILESNELIPRTSEQARLIGIDWFSVISRGSQFKVENIMFRIAKPENLILPSPSRRQVGGQNALECLPLVMEPDSGFYTDPMLVFDFQSLYPSVMIAYNYCYSTFLGRVVNWRGVNKMGFMDYQRQEGMMPLLQDYVNIAPNGIMYVKSQIRKSLLAKMLSEILETRVMVKSGMKVDKDDKTLQRLLNNRQLALKLIANVTYGYTSASFSGRMPCSEIADSIVQTGRETLERAVTFIHSIPEWNAKVVYGDTDSLFVHLKGRTREQAFKIGDEIAKTITNMNPRPIKLKFEKVYHPCVLLAKKRYVGFKYESPQQTKPEFEAKGIETVRRDGTPAEQKIEENALKVLFRTADLSQVKRYVQAQCSKIMRGKVSIQDFCFAKEVRLGTYSDKGIPPPGALISARAMAADPRLEPQYGERVPFVVVTGGPAARLADRCVAPDALLDDSQQSLDAEYYITKNILPPLERIFNLCGGNVRAWYDEMPKFKRIRHVDPNTTGKKKKTTLESYLKSCHCLVCRVRVDTDLPLCARCLATPAKSLLSLKARGMKSEKKREELYTVCRSCQGCERNTEVKCDSKDCPVFYSRIKQTTNFGSMKARLDPVIAVLEKRYDNTYQW